METERYEYITGKRCTSQLIYLLDEKQLYMKKSCYKDKIFYTCYADNCKARIEIWPNKSCFRCRHSFHANHQDQEELYNALKLSQTLKKCSRRFFINANSSNESRKNERKSKSGKNKDDCFDNSKCSWNDDVVTEENCIDDTDYHYEVLKRTEASGSSLEDPMAERQQIENNILLRPPESEKNRDDYFDNTKCSWNEDAIKEEICIDEHDTDYHDEVLNRSVSSSSLLEDPMAKRQRMETNISTHAEVITNNETPDQSNLTCGESSSTVMSGRNSSVRTFCDFLALQIENAQLSRHQMSALQIELLKKVHDFILREDE